MIKRKIKKRKNIYKMMNQDIEIEKLPRKIVFLDYTENVH